MMTIFDFVSAPTPRYMMRLALLEHLIKSVPDGMRHFLEIGPGLGDVSCYVRKRHPTAQGVLVDFSEGSAAMLCKRFESDKGISVLCADFQNQQFAVRFGLIMAFEVLEHVEDDVGVLKKIAQLLEPGGVFLFSVPAFMKKWQQADKYAGHLRRYEREEIIRKIAATGMQVETLWCFGFPLTQLLYPLRQAYYSIQLLRNPRNTKEGATKKSGIERPFAMPRGWLAIDIIFRLFFLLQDMAKDTNAGDGFVIMARRPRVA